LTQKVCIFLILDPPPPPPHILVQKRNNIKNVMSEMSFAIHTPTVLPKKKLHAIIFSQRHTYLGTKIKCERIIYSTRTQLKILSFKIRHRHSVLTSSSSGTLMLFTDIMFEPELCVYPHQSYEWLHPLLMRKSDLGHGVHKLEQGFHIVLSRIAVIGPNFFDIGAPSLLPRFTRSLTLFNCVD